MRYHHTPLYKFFLARASIFDSESYNMTSILEKSLDDIIGENKLRAGRGSSRGRGSRAPGRTSREPSHFPDQHGRSRGGRSNRVAKADFSSIRRSSPAASEPHFGLPKEISNLAGRRPALRIRNIHIDLNGDDLLSLFGTISPVDFIKFDTADDSVAYMCFQRDCARSNAEAITKYDGKKAMGKALVVESAVSLADRIISNPSTRARESRTPDSRTRERGRERRERKPARERKPREIRERPSKATPDSLDAELDSYMNEAASATANDEVMAE